MKKITGLLFLGLITGLGNLSAQQPMQHDTMTNAKPRMQRDSMMPNNGMQRDSMMASGKRNDGDNMMGSKKQMRNDSMMDQGKGMGMNGDNRMASVNKKMNNKKEKAMADVSTWPEASRMAVEEITSKYGKPDGVTAEELIWLNKGVWKKICISKTESKHSFPIEHTDMMQTTIYYNVPEDKMDDLGKFDGSVTFDRTQGTISARCDKEGNNFLALNLANDIITGKKTVVLARKAYGDIIKQKMNGGNPAYMQKLSFAPKSNTADADTNTTGLTKEDVTKAIEKNSAKK